MPSIFAPFLLAIGASAIAIPPAENFHAESMNAVTCPNDITGGRFQFPHLIVPISSQEPNKAFGTAYVAQISPTYSTLFNFDIPMDYTGTCSLVFLFPYGSDLAPSAGKYNFSGTEAEVGMNGGLHFDFLDGVADQGTTYNSAPPVVTDLGKVQIIPGNKYTVSTFTCPTGQRITFEASSRGNVALSYMQNYGNQAIGLYIVPCA